MVFRKTAAVLLVLLILFSGCGPDKYKVRKVPGRSAKKAGGLESNLGSQAASYLYRYYPVHADETEQQRVRRIGSSLAAVSERPNLDWNFIVMTSDNVETWSAPAGYVWISSAAVDYLAEDDYLAAVLAHEIAHVVAKHKYGKIRNRMIASAIMTGAQIGCTTMSAVQASKGDYKSAMAFGGMAGGLQVAQPAVQMIFTRHRKKDELAADQLAMRYMLRAGYNPEKYVKVLGAVNVFDYSYATQAGAAGISPETESRVSHAKQFLAELERLEGIKFAKPPGPELVIKMEPVTEAETKEPSAELPPPPPKVETKAEPKGVWINADDYIGGRSAWQTYWDGLTKSGIIGLISSVKEPRTTPASPAGRLDVGLDEENSSTEGTEPNKEEPQTAPRTA
ncbi:MAG: M48 family metalloprotease [Candidatus Omnitrophica bacterium]|nr:M48 family metalloprotease [Candidatus Omnitrophota bacterium]